MPSKSELENRIIPYKMLLNSMSTTHELIDKILPDGGLPSLRIALEEILSVVRKDIEKAREGLPIVGYHFAFQPEYLIASQFVLKGFHFFLGLYF